MTKIEGVAKEIMKQLAYYAHDVKEKVEDAKNETAQQIKKEITKDSPEKRPSYKKGWRIKRTSKRLIVHNKTDYQLTHLLEYGHILKNRGRNVGETGVHPHIRPAEQRGIKDYLKKIKKAVKP